MEGRKEEIEVLLFLLVDDLLVFLILFPNLFACSFLHDTEG